MTMRTLRLLPLLAVAVAGCRDNRVQQVPPTIGLEAITYELGAVKVGTEVTLPVPVTAATGADLVLSQVSLSGSPAFTITSAPELVPGLATEPVTVRYAPTAAMADSTELVLRSNDELNPEVRVTVSGHGAHPALALEVGCDPATRCEATVASSPPSVTFAAEPFVRLRPLEVPELPKLVFRSTGEVPLTLTTLALAGADVTAFSFVGNAALPDGGLVLAPGASASVPLRFRPTADTQARYVAQVNVVTDDPQALAVTVPLEGALRPNLPPRVCLNVARVAPADRPAVDFDTPAGWAQALAADGGVDYRATRDVPPRAEVQLSALSSAADETACTSDPEDGRLGLTWAWRLVSQPAGSTPVTLLNATSPRATLRPFATGDYVAELTVTDSQGNATTQAITFEVAVKNDLVVQLEWSGGAGVDLDVHLVRPAATTSGQPFAGAFSPFADFSGTLIAGDINGYATTARPDGGTFDWGQPGRADDPQLNFDDTGSGQLIENISLNFPENDPGCAASACTYRVLVHGFRDSRPVGSPVACEVDGGAGCQDGDACDCGAGNACVALSAPLNAAPAGAGRCLPTVNPVVRVFVKGSATPAAIIPMSGAMPLGAPCQLLHVADVAWPARGSDAGVVVTPQAGVARFGVRGLTSLQCAPDGPQAGVPWYRQQPR